MAPYKRNKTWWTDFSVNGQRYRESLDTSDWREAQRREKEIITRASEGKVSASSERFAWLPFSQAADSYVADRASHLAQRSVRTETERLKPLRTFFGATSLSRISSDAIREYVGHRKQGNAGNRTVNLEVGILRRILKRAKRWNLVADEITRLPERRNVGRAMRPDEKLKLLKVAASRPEWQIARLAMTVALNTTMRACEIRGLQWRDIDLMNWTLTIRRSKTDAGERVIPLNGNVWTAILELRERAKLLCGSEPQPDWYVFPSGEGQGPVTRPKNRPGPEVVTVKPDPTKPMSTWRTAWRKISKAAGLPGLRFHDLRHHAITELAESQASDQTVMAIAGHVSPKMLAHYSHVRLEAKRKALDALAGGIAGGCYVTMRDTKFGDNPSSH